MIFKKWNVALVALMLLAPLSASALGVVLENVSTTGASTTLLDGGDVITFDLRIENDGNEEIFGLGVGAWGYDSGAPGNANDNRLRFSSGSTSDQVFSTVNVPSVGSVGGLPTQVSMFEDGFRFPISKELNMQLLRAAEVASSNGDGSLDTGVDGGLVGAGDVQIRVSFLAQELATAGDVTLTFGTGEFGNEAIGNGGAVLGGFTNAQWTMTIVPEPGTALLMGLGLAGLATRRRR